MDKIIEGTSASEKQSRDSVSEAKRSQSVRVKMVDQEKTEELNTDESLQEENKSAESLITQEGIDGSEEVVDQMLSEPFNNMIMKQIENNPAFG